MDLNAMAGVTEPHAKARWAESGIEGDRTWRSSISQPMVVKAQAIKSATEAATLLLKIDDVIASTKSKGPPPGRRYGWCMAEGGMGGMPPMM
jgi:chaperonin GroEL (HSP60 family)